MKAAHRPTPGESSLDPVPVAPVQNRGMVPLLLLLLALADLQIEFRLLFDHFTFSGLSSAVRSHSLAVAVLVLQPSLWRHYRRRLR